MVVAFAVIQVNTEVRWEKVRKLKSLVEARKVDSSKAVTIIIAVIVATIVNVAITSTED